MATPTGIDQVRFAGATVSAWQIKVVLVVLGLGIMAAVLYYTKSIVDDLVENEERTVQLYANFLVRLAQGANDEDLLFYLEITETSIHFPVIITTSNEEPVYPYPQFMLNVELDTALTVDQQANYVRQRIAEMKSEYPPFEIKDPNGRVIQKVFFQNSAIVRRLRYMPFYEILIVTAFILVGYIAFSTIRRNEESNIWVGMSKEAAHQLGTPLSSLLAWLEILRTSGESQQSRLDTITEMEQDVERLNVIANRFSKIGSLPERRRMNVAVEVERVCRYFDSRIPNLGRKVVISRSLDENVEAELNSDLLAWVLENLIKNAVEAIERRDSQIDITLQPRSKGGAVIEVRDNGKGLTSKEKKRVFRPGYTTKRRGWGLGLSLSKRIIEEYHRGKLYVRESTPGSGTTFVIEIP